TYSVAGPPDCKRRVVVIPTACKALGWGGRPCQVTCPTSTCAAEGVLVRVDVSVGIGVFVDVFVGVLVLVGVTVGVNVLVGVKVFVGVLVLVGVAVVVKVLVGVLVFVPVEVIVGVLVGVPVVQDGWVNVSCRPELRLAVLQENCVNSEP